MYDDDRPALVTERQMAGMVLVEAPPWSRVPASAMELADTTGFLVRFPRLVLFDKYSGDSETVYCGILRRELDVVSRAA